MTVYSTLTFIKAVLAHCLISSAVSRQELVPWLQERISEQTRIDLGTSGVPSLQIDMSSPVLPKEQSTQFDVQLLLPGDAKKQRKQTKQIFLDRGMT